MKARRAQQKFVDYDYIDKLTDAEREWLQEFTNSHYADGKMYPENSKRRREAYQRAWNAREDITNYAQAVTLEDAGLE